MKKYDRNTIRNTENRFKFYNNPNPKNIDNECNRVATLVERFTEIYQENPKLFTEHHIVLPVFLRTCAMASCTEPRTEPWILNDDELYILNFVKDNYLFEWNNLLHKSEYGWI